MFWLYQEGYIDIDITQRIKLPKDDSEIVIPLTRNEVAAIDEYIINSELALRNYCIFHLLLDCGLRRQEVINLKTDCIRKNTLTIKNSKNNKSRIVLLPDFLRMSINNYLGKRSGVVFLDRYNEEQITENSIKKMFANIKNLPGNGKSTCTPFKAYICNQLFILWRQHGNAPSLDGTFFLYNLAKLCTLGSSRRADRVRIV